MTDYPKPFRDLSDAEKGETGEWIEHDGLNIPSLGFASEGKRRDGKIARIPSVGWRYLLWSHLCPSPQDIIAYRVVKP